MLFTKPIMSSAVTLPPLLEAPAVPLVPPFALIAPVSVIVLVVPLT